ncbi:MAG: hypothetical protein IPJ65_36430 [Archangiaceae bacterium]|nr:hypothetical protein [Archangiaceae bacterium]
MRALVFMVLLGADALPPEPKGTCSFEGRVVLTRDSEPIEPNGVVVYVDKQRDSNHTPKTHRMEQKDREFKPQVLVVHTDDWVQFVNMDKYAHDVYSADERNAFYAQASKRDTTEKREFKIAGPVRIGCQLHRNMRADLLVLENDWFDANLSRDGQFHIRDVPAGARVTLSAWEPNGGKKTIEVRGCKGTTQVKVITLEEQMPPPKIDPGY